MPALRVDLQAVPTATGTEYLIWLRVPAAGGDGILLGVCESELAAREIARALDQLLGCCHSHQPAI